MADKDNERVKAYYASIWDDPDAGGEVVFANTAREAKKEAWGLDFTAFCDSYIYLRVNRWKELDGCEKLTEREMALKKWQNGWWWDSDEPSFDDYGEHTDEDFLAWYDERHEAKSNE